MIGEKTYVPKPDTRAAMALDFIQTRMSEMRQGEWLANTEVATFLGCLPNAVRPSLEPAVEAGLLERSVTSKGCTQWRMATAPKRHAANKLVKSTKLFSLDNWPPGFVSRFATVVVSAYETRTK